MSSESALDALYRYITSSERDNTELQKALLSSSYPSPISLKLQEIQGMLKENEGPMNTDSINFAIRILRREETIDRSPNLNSLVHKYYFTADFERLASTDGQSDLEACVYNGYVYHHHNAFGQADLSCHSKKDEVLFIPVHHDDGSWSLYAFNMSDKKLSILDPTPKHAFNMSHQKFSIIQSTTDCAFNTDHQNCSILDGPAERAPETESRDGNRLDHKLANRLNFGGFLCLPESEHDKIRLKICKALGFVKDKFNLFENTSGDFSSWRYEFTDLSRFTNGTNDKDSGFFVFYFMLSWDGRRFIDPEKIIPKTTEDLRKGFLEYIVSSNYNEVYHQADDLANLPDVFKLMERLRSQKASAGCPPLTRCKMDTKLLKAARENNVEEFKTMQQNIVCQGANCDGDGVLHIAARYGDLELLHAIFQKVNVDLNLEHMKRRLLEGTVRDDNDCVYVTMEDKRVEQQQKLVMLLRSRNHKGETCLHEAVRRDNTLLALSLILVDAEIKDDDSSLPPLVQRVDYEGVSPLYLAATLCRSDIVEILTDKNNNYIASFSGPGGKTALHAAVVLWNKGLTEQLLTWTNSVEDVPDLTIMADNSGNTPLHLVSSVPQGAAIADLLLPKTPRDRLLPSTPSDSSDSRLLPSALPGTSSDRLMREPATCAALMKDSKGWLPIHVAAANGSLGVVEQLIDRCPECIGSRTATGQSFLHVAVDKKKRNVVKYVCSRQSLAGILNLTDQDGNTALHLAVEGGNQRIFCALMGNPRVQLNSENREGRTPRDVANLSLGPGLHLLMSSRVLINNHLKLSGAHYGTRRRDVLNGEIEGKLDKANLSETISKSAALMAVCAFFIVDMSMSTFFNVHQLDPNTGVAAAKGRSARVKARTFKALITFDAITFASAILAAFCCTFAGFSIMDRPTRFIYLSIAGFFFQIACLGLIAIFILAAYLAFTPLDPHIATVTCVLPLAAITPQLMTPAILLLLHAWTLSRRWFPKHVFPILQRIYSVLSRVFPRIRSFFEPYLPDRCFTWITKVYAAIMAAMGAIWTCLISYIFTTIWTFLISYLFTPIIALFIFIFKCIGYCILLLLGMLVVLGLPVLLVVFIVSPEP